MRRLPGWSIAERFRLDALLRQVNQVERTWRDLSWQIGRAVGQLRLILAQLSRVFLRLAGIIKPSKRGG